MTENIALLINTMEKIKGFCSGDEVLLVNNQRIRSYELFRKYENIISQYIENEETYLLTIPLYREMLEYALDMIHIPIRSILDNSYREITDLAITIQKCIDESGSTQYFDRLMERVERLMNLCQFRFDPALLTESSKVALIIGSAFSQAEKIKERCDQVTEGKYSDVEPVIYNQLIDVKTMYQFYRNLKKLPENAVLFGSIHQTVGGVEDRLYEEIHGYPEELVRNTSHNCKCSHDEAREKYHEYSSKMLVGIKNGENIWIYSENNYETVIHQDFFYNGFRNTYFPYQVFFNEMEKPSSLNGLEVVPFHEGWQLKDILDEEQALFFVILFLKLSDIFFKKRVDKSGERKVFWEDYRLLPPSKPTDLTCGNEIPIRTIYKTFREEERNLLEILQLSSADSFSENLLLNGLVEQTVMGDVVEKRANSLLCAKVRSELQIICEAERQSSAASRWFRQHQNVMNCFWKVPNRVKIIKNNEPIEMLSGEILKEYGEPMIGHTSLEDGRKSDSYPHIMHLFSENATVGKRPSAKVVIIPKTAEDIMVLTGASYDELPIYFKVLGYVTGEIKFLEERIALDRPIVPHMTICYNKNDLKKFLKWYKEEHNLEE